MLAILAKSSVFLKPFLKFWIFFQFLLLTLLKCFINFQKNCTNFCYFLIVKEKALKYNIFLKNWLLNEISTVINKGKRSELRKSQRRNPKKTSKNLETITTLKMAF